MIDPLIDSSDLCPQCGGKRGPWKSTDPVSPCRCNKPEPKMSTPRRAIPFDVLQHFQAQIDAVMKSHFPQVRHYRFGGYVTKSPDTQTGTIWLVLEDFDLNGSTIPFRLSCWNDLKRRIVQVLSPVVWSFTDQKGHGLRFPRVDRYALEVDALAVCICGS